MHLRGLLSGGTPVPSRKRKYAPGIITERKPFGELTFVPTAGGIINQPGALGERQFRLRGIPSVSGLNPVATNAVAHNNELRDGQASPSPGCHKKPARHQQLPGLGRCRCSVLVQRPPAGRD